MLNRARFINSPGSFILSTNTDYVSGPGIGAMGYKDDPTGVWGPMKETGISNTGF